MRAIAVLLVCVAVAVSLTGCGDSTEEILARAVADSQREVHDARRESSELKSDLTETEGELSRTREELGCANEHSDDLTRQVASERSERRGMEHRAIGAEDDAWVAAALAWTLSGLVVVLAVRPSREKRARRAMATFIQWLTERRDHEDRDEPPELVP